MPDRAYGPAVISRNDDRPLSSPSHYRVMIRALKLGENFLPVPDEPKPAKRPRQASAPFFSHLILANPNSKPTP